MGKNKIPARQKRLMRFCKAHGVNYWYGMDENLLVKPFELKGVVDFTGCGNKSPLPYISRAVNAWIKDQKTVTHNSPKERRKGYSQKKAAAKKFYSSWEWKKLRYEVLKTYGAKCMCCGSIENICVDHIKPRSKPEFKHLELEFDNMQVLCDCCNRGKSNDDYTDFRDGHNIPEQDRLTQADVQVISHTSWHNSLH